MVQKFFRGVATYRSELGRPIPCMIDFQIGNAQSMHHHVHRPMIDLTEKSDGTKILSGSQWGGQSGGQRGRTPQHIGANPAGPYPDIYS